MTSRVQVLRSSTTGAVPAAGTRAPGEIFVNFADLQAGVIDALKNAQKLIAVRYFSATANYVAGDFVIQAGVLYAAKGAITAGAFNATQWTQIAAATDANGPYLSIAGGTLTGALMLSGPPSANLHAATKAYADGLVVGGPFVPLAGSTMTGLLTLSGPPSTPLHAATKAYVDSGAFVPIAGGANTGLNDNRIVNGDMRIDQRGVASGGGGTANGYTCDRWQYGGTQASKGTWGRPGGISAPGFPYALQFTSASAYASLAADAFYFTQPIEADQVSDFAWGTANAQSVTLSFWAFSTNLTGTFSGTITNYAGTRSYPFTYAISAANTWTKIAITIPGDTAGTWVMSGSGGAFFVNFDLGSGTNFRAPAGAWGAGNRLGATGAVNVVSTNGATFYVTGVKLELGSVATPFNRQSLTKSMADCQRYYQQFNPQLSTQGYNGVGAAVHNTFPFPVVMRATPTVAFANQAYNNASAVALSAVNVDLMRVQVTITAAGYGYGTASATMTAEL